MPTYLHPGVYVEEIPSGAKPIEGVATSVAAFVGYTPKGPLGVPNRITNWDAYLKDFGGIIDTGSSKTGDPMGHAVSAFFKNGGTTAYIVRITQNWDDESAKDAYKAVAYMDHPAPEDTDHALKFEAVNEGDWANGLIARVDAMAHDASVYQLDIGRLNRQGNFVPVETFTHLSMDQADRLFIEGVVNGESELVTVKVVDQSEAVALGDQGLYLGQSISEDLSGLTLPLNLSDLTDTVLEITLDGKSPPVTITLATSYADLPALASDIQQKVRGTETSEWRAEFTCGVTEDGKQLVLTSGTRLPESSVVVTPTKAAAGFLKLGTDNGGTERTGAESAEADWESATPSTDFLEATLSGGANGSAPLQADYHFTAFVKIRDINIISLPGQVWKGAGKAVIQAAIAHAEKMTNRMVIVDPPTDKELTTETDVVGLGLPTSTYTVLYYPWPKVANPYYNAETKPGVPQTVLVPPSGFAAGIWSKIDGRRGVWKAPAGVETGLLGLAGLQHVVEDGEQDVLNPLGVNCLRSLPNFGSVVWGARTLSTKANPEWRYVPVRRTAIMIEQSIYGGIQWAVFEPNNHLLWSALRTNIEGFMNGLFRSGAFQGETASKAYFVRCGLGDTMTQGDIDRGQVIVIVGFAPLKPAEFVIVRIQQKVGKQ